ncbi:hypothetical protein L596_021255 [Steinernema carpocapsae]|uniref:Uncharacterized protein n=1 Tax=Steinernema carpocapsae TaxID=34508 RepID=A0A4U5MXF6_STECR|nr:hypothetical protein L596_021255 [Steinernema carpocapsae]
MMECITLFASTSVLHSIILHQMMECITLFASFHLGAAFHHFASNDGMHHPFALFQPGAAFHHFASNDGMHHPFCFRSLRWSNPQHWYNTLDCANPFSCAGAIRNIGMICRIAPPSLAVLEQSATLV